MAGEETQTGSAPEASAPATNAGVEPEAPAETKTTPREEPGSPAPSSATPRYEVTLEDGRIVQLENETQLRQLANMGARELARKQREAEEAEKTQKTEKTRNSVPETEDITEVIGSLKAKIEELEGSLQTQKQELISRDVKTEVQSLMSADPIFKALDDDLRETERVAILQHMLLHNTDAKTAAKARGDHLAKIMGEDRRRSLTDKVLATQGALPGAGGATKAPQRKPMTRFDLENGNIENAIHERLRAARKA